MQQQISATGAVVTVVHYTYEMVPGEFVIACMPGVKDFGHTKYHPPYIRTNDARAVTCPACKRSNNYKVP